jgi:hypothetical protein
MNRAVSQENFLLKRHKDICSEIVSVYFGTNWEFIENMESEWIPYDCTVVHQIPSRYEIAGLAKIWHPKDLAVTQNRNVNRT